MKAFLLVFALGLGTASMADEVDTCKESTEAYVCITLYQPATCKAVVGNKVVASSGTNSCFARHELVTTLCRLGISNLEATSITCADD